MLFVCQGREVVKDQERCVGLERHGLVVLIVARRSSRCGGVGIGPRQHDFDGGNITTSLAATAAKVRPVANRILPLVFLQKGRCGGLKRFVLGQDQPGILNTIIAVGFVAVVVDAVVVDAIGGVGGTGRGRNNDVAHVVLKVFHRGSLTTRTQRCLNVFPHCDLWMRIVLLIFTVVLHLLFLFLLLLLLLLAAAIVGGARVRRLGVLLLLFLLPSLLLLVVMTQSEFVFVFLHLIVVVILRCGDNDCGNIGGRIIVHD